MTQRELEQAVARVTGETLAEIRRRGFSLLKGPGPKSKPAWWKSRRKPQKDKELVHA